MHDNDAETALRGLAHETWDDAIKDRNLPMFARLRALEHSMKTLGFDDARRLVTEARAAMAFAASRAAQVSAIARSGIGSDPSQVMFLGGMAIGDCSDISKALLEGLDALDDRGLER